MPPIPRIIFFCEKHYGGYGDRLIGMASAITIARILGFSFTYSWEPEFMSLCKKAVLEEGETQIPHLNLLNERTSAVLENEPLQLLKNSLKISANIPIDRLLWKNPHFSLGSYDAEAIRSFKEIMPALGFSTPGLKYECGVQIRCGDTYCMPHAQAVQYIPEGEWPRLASAVKNYLVRRGFSGAIYLTSDTYKIYEHFLKLNDDAIQFTVISRKEDIHFDFYNSNNRYKEIVDDHNELQMCRRIITGLRSNYGTTAAYCSPVCDELIIYDLNNSEIFTEYNPREKVVLKEHLVHVKENGCM
jgi:hypothetical protein